MSGSDDADATRSHAPDVVATTVAPRVEVAPGDMFVDEPEHYAVDRQIGAGGMGVVFAATGSRFGRTVALKLVTVDREDLRRRFEREGQVTARLQHPAIVPVYGSGSGRDGLPFYAMKQVSGEPLDKVIASAPTLAERIALVPKVITVAEAVAYAHAEQVIHRDLKPANILVGGFGETIIIDWGLAKDLARGDDDDTVSPFRTAGADETAIGKVMGTPAYMPREQARGDRVDQRADVYAIGAILYHVLSGRPPYQRPDEHSVPWENMLARVLADEPASLATVQPEIPPDLLAIVTRAMAVDAAQRYASAGELADDLKRFQTGQFVGAHRYTTSQLIRRWARRHRTPLYVAGIAAAVLAILAIVGVERIVDERDRADDARGSAEIARTEAETQRSVAVSKQAEATRRADDLTLLQARSLLDKDPTASLAFLKALGPTFDGWDRAWLVAVAARAAGVARHVEFRDHDVAGVGLSPDGTRMVTTALDKELWVTDLAARTHRTFVAGDTVFQSRFTPDNRSLVTSGLEHDIRVWNLDDGTSRRLAGHDKRIDALVVTKDGTRAISTSADGTVRVWNVATGTSVKLAGSVQRAFTIALSPDEKRFAAAALQHVQVWDLTTPDAQPRAFELPKPIRGLTFTPDGRELATTDCSAVTIRLTTIESGAVRQLDSGDIHDTFLTDIAMSPDGTHIAAAGGDGVLRVWELATGKRAANLAAHTGSISTFGYVDDARVVTCGDDATCIVWELATGTPIARYAGHGAPVINARLSRVHTTLVTGSRDHTARVWDVAAHTTLTLPKAIAGVRFDPAGTAVIVSGDVGIQLWAFADDKRTVVTDRPVSSARFSSDGKLLAWGDDGKSVVVLDRATQTQRVLAGHTAGVWGIAFSPDDKHLASSGMDKTVRVWDLATGESIELTGHTDIVADVAFAPDGRHLASVGLDSQLRIWDLATRTGRAIPMPTQLFNVKYAPDGRTVSVVGNDSAVRLVDVATGTIRLLRGHSGIVYATSWSPDGALLASAGGDGRVWLWDVKSGAGEALRGHKSDVEDVAFSPDGKRLASASTHEHTLRLWDLDVPRGGVALKRWLDATTDATVDANGQLK